MKPFEWLKARWIAWVWKHTPNCAEMSRLASQALERALPPGKRFKMRLHYLICAWCRRYSRQLKFLHDAAPHFHEYTEALPGQGLSAEARQRIVQRLRAVHEV